MGYFLVLISLLFNFSADPAEEIEKLRTLYPKESVVFTKRNQTYDFRVIGDSLAITVYHDEEMAFLTDNVAPFVRDQIYTSSFYKAKNIKANTLNPGNRKWESVPVTEFRTVGDNDNSIFYDDSEFITFTYPGVKKNSKTSLQYEAYITDPHFMGKDFFAAYVPVVQSKYTFIYDQNVKLKHFLFNIDSDKLIKEETLENGRIKVTFEMKSIEKTEYEANAPSFSYLAPHISTLVESYEGKDGKAIEVLNDTDALYRWYWTFIDGLKEEESEQAKAILESILTPDDSELDKVRKIYYWVQNNIKYIAFEDGMRGFVPHKGDYVCTMRYGDCKDMASILVNLMYHAGIDGYYTWIGTRDIPYKYTELPTTSVDNHMIATYIGKDGKYYFLDATGQYQPFGLPTSMIQGKEALIGYGPDSYEIVLVPEIDKEVNKHADTYQFTIANGAINGKGELDLTGYAKVFNTYKMINSDERDTRDYITKLLNRGNNKFFIEHYKIEGLDDYDQPIKVNYDFRVEDYYREINGSIYFNMNLDKAFSNSLIEETRVHPIEEEYRYTNVSVAKLTIPEGFEVSFLPQNSEYQGKTFGYSMSYEQTEESVTLTRTFYKNYLLMDKSDFQDWNTAIENFTKDNKSILILKEKK